MISSTTRRRGSSKPSAIFRTTRAGCSRRVVRSLLLVVRKCSSRAGRRRCGRDVCGVWMSSCSFSSMVAWFRRDGSMEFCRLVVLHRHRVLVLQISSKHSTKQDEKEVDISMYTNQLRVCSVMQFIRRPWYTASKPYDQTLLP